MHEIECYLSCLRSKEEEGVDMGQARERERERGEGEERERRVLNQAISLFFFLLEFDK